MKIIIYDKTIQFMKEKMKENLSKNIGIFFTYLSLFIIVKYSISSLVDIYHLYSKGEINNFVNEYVRVLQNFIFFGSFLSLFISRFKAFSLVIPFAFWEVDYSFFGTIVSSIIIPNNSGMSPEYIRIIIFLLIVGVFLFRTIWKKRKFSDIFLFLSMSGVLFTAILFHIVTLKQLDYFTNIQEKRWEQVMEYKNITQFCKNENLYCEEIVNKENIKEEHLKAYFNEVQPYIEKNQNYFNYFISSDNVSKTRILARKPAAFIKYDNKIYYMLDKENYTDYLKFNERMFGLLAMSSHIVWIFGALYLIYFHTKRRVKLIKKELNN